MKKNIKTKCYKYTKKENFIKLENIEWKFFKFVIDIIDTKERNRKKKAT